MRERALLSALPGADHCIVCGSSNPIGLRLQFWTEDERVVSEFVARPEFQGFDNLFQGGVLSAILDDLMVRTIWRHHGLNVTGKMEVTFRRPIRIGTTVRVEGEAAEPLHRTVEATARALLPDGSVAADARGTFVLVDADKLAKLAHG
jgi:acyl-coenzyme A thioesterase PaaI-like protein